MVAGFQGLNRYDDITTLGRGGSDTSAVAIAAALHADLCQIYTDVDGVYTADPRMVPGAKKLEEITYDEMLELATLGAQVLNNRSRGNGEKIQRGSGGALQLGPGARHKRQGGQSKVENMLIKGVAKDNDVARISMIGRAGRAGHRL